jgi:hypothetical protein
LNKSKPFCYAPWTTIQYSGVYEGGGTSPCCEWRGGKYKGDVKDYEHSDYLNNIKEIMLNHDIDKISKTCAECINYEKHGTGQSARQYIERDVKNGKYEVGKISKLDFRPDNLCNLKCRMCSAYSSSLIEEEQISRGYIEPIEKRSTDDVLDFDLDNLKVLALLGGEPTVNKKLYPVLDHFINSGQAKDMRLNFTTNCTSINPKWLSRVKQFGDMHINLSLDAAYSAYEYIRTGASWAEVEKNIPVILDLTNDYNIQMVVQATSFVCIENWLEYFYDYPVEKINLNPIYGTKGGLDCIPDSIKNKKIEWLEKQNHPLADKALKVFKYYKFNYDSLYKYFIETLKYDKIRNTSIFDLHNDFREMYEIAKKHYVN